MKPVKWKCPFCARGWMGPDDPTCRCPSCDALGVPDKTKGRPKEAAAPLFIATVRGTQECLDMVKAYQDRTGTKRSQAVLGLMQEAGPDLEMAETFRKVVALYMRVAHYCDNDGCGECYHAADKDEDCLLIERASKQIAAVLPLVGGGAELEG